MRRIDLTEGRNRVLGQTVGQIVALAIGAEVYERQDRQHDGQTVNVWHHRDVGHEPIAFSGHRFDKGGRSMSLGRILQSLPDLPNRSIDARLRIDKDVTTPEPRDDVRLRYQLPASFDKEDEQVHGLTLEPDAAALAP